MTTTIPIPVEIDPSLDLVLERQVPVSVAKVWAAWTQPELLKRWFTPRPYETTLAELDVRPGGLFRTTMRSPEGEEFPGDACYLDVVEHERLVWTTVLGAGYRPNADVRHDLALTAILAFEDDGQGGTRYRAIARHADPAAASQHQEMGFLDGWGTVLDQLVEVMA